MIEDYFLKAFDLHLRIYRNLEDEYKSKTEFLTSKGIQIYYSREMIKQNKIDLKLNKFFDMVTRNEALEKMVNSLHCLLSIGNLNPSQLPSKVIEYISTGKPVIHFVEIQDDPVLEIANEFSNL